MAKRPLVSIITPAYNRSAVIASAIESVLAQTMPDWELILIDDASNDSTYAVMEAYARLDRRIRVLHNETNSRRGPIEWEPRNDGLKVACGSLIAYLDADNTWRPRFVERLSALLIEKEYLQLVYCDSCNHYSPEERKEVVARDRRKLIDSGPTWTVFSHDVLDTSRLGVDQYIDTNEMMHRASTFMKLDCLWRTWHPRREFVNARQGKRCPYRRHNDLDLFERILEEYGMESVLHLHEVHVEFFYPSADRAARTPSIALPGLPRSTELANAIHPQTRSILRELNIDHFRRDYLVGCANRDTRHRPSVVHEFGKGEIGAIPGLDLPGLYREFVAGGELRELMTRYDGTLKLAAAYRTIAEYYNGAIGWPVFDEFSLAPFDGCHNALENAISVFSGTEGCAGARDTVAFPVPAYPYWKIAAAARRAAFPIEAYDSGSLVAALESLDDPRIGAVILAFPGNPLGYEFNSHELSVIGRLAQERQWGIVIDITYSAFLRNESPLAPLRELPPDRTILCDGVSKAWGLPGLRLGYGLSSDAEVAAALRANKSGESLLPSSLKQAFFSHLVMHQPEIPERIVAAVTGAKRRAREFFRAKPLAEWGMEIPSCEYPGMYEVLYIDRLCKRSGLSPTALAAGLLVHAGVDVAPSPQFFPATVRGKLWRPFLRLSFGRVRDVDAGLEALWEGLVGQISGGHGIARARGLME